MPGFVEPAAGDLTARLVLEKASVTPSGTDAMAVSYTEVDRISARPKTLFGGHTLAGEQTERRVSHVFTIRYRDDARDGAWDHIQFDGRRFAVRLVQDPEERKRWLELHCDELGAVG